MSETFASVLKAHVVRISMDGKGRRVRRASMA